MTSAPQSRSAASASGLPFGVMRAISISIRLAADIEPIIVGSSCSSDERRPREAANDEASASALLLSVRDDERKGEATLPSVAPIDSLSVVLVSLPRRSRTGSGASSSLRRPMVMDRSLIARWSTPGVKLPPAGVGLVLAAPAGSLLNESVSAVVYVPVPPPRVEEPLRCCAEASVAKHQSPFPIEPN